MAAKQKEQIGTYKCWSCGKEVPVKKLSGSGKLAAPCGWCDWINHYADPGSKHFKNLLAATKLDAPAELPVPPKSDDKKEEKKETQPPPPARARSLNPFAGR